MSFDRQDANLILTTALPNGAATTASTGLDLETTSKATSDGRTELKINAPALAVGPLANGKTMKYSVWHSDAANFAGEEMLADSVVLQTGADGAGAVAKEGRFRPPSNVKRHVRVKATGSAAGDASASSFTVAVTF